MAVSFTGTGTGSLRLPFACPDPTFVPTSSLPISVVPVPVPALGNVTFGDGAIPLFTGVPSRFVPSTVTGPGVTALPTGMIPLVRATASAECVVLRGGASPIASCIALVRSRVTSVPHCTSARWAAVPVSWQSEKSTWTERASVRPAPDRPAELARALDGASHRVRPVVDRDARGLEQDLGVEPAVEQELRGVVPAARQGGQQVGGRRLLPSLLGGDLRQFGGARQAPSPGSVEPSPLF